MRRSGVPSLWRMVSAVSWRTLTVPSGRTIRYSEFRVVAVTSCRSVGVHRCRSSGWTRSTKASTVPANVPGSIPMIRHDSSDHHRLPVAMSRSQLPTWAIRCAASRCWVWDGETSCIGPERCGLTPFARYDPNVPLADSGYASTMPINPNLVRVFKLLDPVEGRADGAWVFQYHGEDFLTNPGGGNAEPFSWNDQAHEVIG